MSIIFLIPLVGLILFDVASYAVFRTLGMYLPLPLSSLGRAFSRDRQRTATEQQESAAYLATFQSVFRSLRLGNTALITLPLCILSGRLPTNLD